MFVWLARSSVVAAFGPAAAAPEVRALWVTRATLSSPTAIASRLLTDTCR
jgi:hypothetical protein